MTPQPAARKLLRAALCFAVAVALTLPPRLWAMGPLERNPDTVQQGLNAYEAGKYDEALKAFDDAKQELPNSPALEFDRANTLFKLGRVDEAKEAYHRVADMDHGALRAKDLYNLGNAWAQLGNDKEAISAFRRALIQDPNDEQARHNLEVMLRKIPPPPPPSPDGGSDGGEDAGHDGGSPDAGRDGGQPRDGGMDGGQDGGQPDAGDGGSDAGSGDAGQGDGGVDGGSDGGSGGKGNQHGDAGKPDDDEQGGQDGGSGDGMDGGTEDAEMVGLDGGAADLSRKDAERLLDSMKQTEKNLQLWRFQQRKKNRRPNEKDW